MSAVIDIRPAGEAGHSILQDLLWRASIAVPEDRDVLLANRCAVELPIDYIEAGCVFVAEREGVLAGFGTVLPRADGDADLDAMFVEPALWGQGIGRALMGEAERRARGYQAPRLRVIAGMHAKGFYEALGFVPDGPFRTRFGMGLAMHKTLG